MARLGSAPMATVTPGHYAACLDEEGYRNPLQLANGGEVPTDLFAQLHLSRATTTPPDATTIRNIPNREVNQGVVSDVPDRRVTGRYRASVWTGGQGRSA